MVRLMFELKKCTRSFLLALACFSLLLGSVCAAEETRAIIDSRGVEVKVPVDINRVVTISDGLVESVMTLLGVQEKLVGLGSECLPKVWQFEYPSVKGGNFTYNDGMNPVNYLNPWIRELPLVCKSGTAVNYETLAGLDPDVVILRLGDCTFQSPDDENAKKTILSIESMSIPLIVLYGPPCFDKPGKEVITEEMRILGQLFAGEEKTMEVAEYLESIVDMVQERTRDIPEAEKPKVLMFGLSPNARNEGGAGTAHGLTTIESNFIEEIANAKNAYQENVGNFQVLSTEQVLALDPDVIVLCTAWGYHPPRELYEAPYYQNLQEMDAIKNQRVMALPWTPCNCAKRLEYPIDVMVIAKAAYPERFQDIDLDPWLLEFYQKVYGVDEEKAEGIRIAQFMDWTVEESAS